METERQPRPQAHDWKPQGAKIPKIVAKKPTIACVLSRRGQIQSNRGAANIIGKGSVGVPLADARGRGRPCGRGVTGAALPGPGLAGRIFDMLPSNDPPPGCKSLVSSAGQECR